MVRLKTIFFKIFITSAVLGLTIGTISYKQILNDKKVDISEFYIRQLLLLKNNAIQLQETIRRNEPIRVQKTAFESCRKTYKRLSVITDYFYPFETILLNSPAIDRSEDDNPSVIEPHGFQQLESLIWKEDTSAKIITERINEIIYISGIIDDLLAGTDSEKKYPADEVLAAIRSSLVTLVTKTITGFDSPIAQYSLVEATAVLEGVQSVFSLYEKTADAAFSHQCLEIATRLQQAKQYLAQQKNFNAFDRLYFIKDLINRASDAITALAVQSGYTKKNERRPVKPNVPNIFSKDAFDVNFFSPNKRFQSTPERISLGKILFNNTDLSSNGTRSCASCHNPSLAFTDGLAKPTQMDGITQLQRNTPTLLNAVFQTKQFYDSRETMLEFQVNSVVHNKEEMGGSIEKVAAKLREQLKFLRLFAKAYPSEKEPVNAFTIANAIASYVRSLQSMNSRFDLYMRGKRIQFSSAEKNGFNLFAGKAKCATCHFIPLFNGLAPPQFTESESEVIGVPASLNKPATLDPDSGKYYFTKSPVDLFAFKTPTLRNIALTAPYMHNGVYQTLEEVIDFYNDGGGQGLDIAPPNQTLPFEKLDLTKKEKKDIIAFLHTLTDTSAANLVP